VKGAQRIEHRQYFISMMYRVYILYSPSLDRFYVGQTNDLKNRIEEHNNGESSYTSGGTPWILIWSARKASFRAAESLEEKLKNLSRSRKIKFMYKNKELIALEIGPITAANIFAEIGDLRRFRSLKKLAGYIGISPGMYCSGDNERTLGPTPRSNRTIRSLIIEASWVAIRLDPVLQQYFRKHAGKDSKAAIFKVARKLLSRIHAVIRTGLSYEIGIIQ